MDAPIVDPSVITSIGGLGGIGGLVAAWMYVRKQLSRDATTLEEDRAARDQLKRMEEENVRLLTQLQACYDQLQSARTNGAQRNEDVILIASLESENKMLLRDVQRMLKRMPSDVRSDLKRSGVIETNFGMLGDVEERIEPSDRSKSKRR